MANFQIRRFVSIQNLKTQNLNMPICHYCFDWTDRGLQYHHPTRWEETWIRPVCIECMDYCNEERAHWCLTRQDGFQLIPLFYSSVTKTWEKNQPIVDCYHRKSPCSTKCALARLKDMTTDEDCVSTVQNTDEE